MYIYTMSLVFAFVDCIHNGILQPTVDDHKVSFQMINIKRNRKSTRDINQILNG